ncbi:MAG TPA: hypothetical protein VIC85_10555 [Ktedonobacterales bacterium]
MRASRSAVRCARGAPLVHNGQRRQCHEARFEIITRLGDAERVVERGHGVIKAARLALRA